MPICKSCIKEGLKPVNSCLHTNVYIHLSVLAGGEEILTKLARHFCVSKHFCSNAKYGGSTVSDSWPLRALLLPPTNKLDATSAKTMLKEKLEENSHTRRALLSVLFLLATMSAAKTMHNKKVNSLF
jgi:hypothetical protein